MPVLKKGSKGKDVKEIQQLLNKAGAKPKLDEDGMFGPLTDKAVRAFQKTSKLKVDGIVGKNTMAALKGGGAAAPKPKKISIKYNVVAYKQPTNMSCWATAIAMMVSWKKSMSIDPKTIADVLGYTKEFKSKGLHPEDTKVFKKWGLKWEAPMCYSVQGFADLLKTKGPLWLAGNPKAPHVRVVTGMAGDGTPEGTKVSINDPAGGKQYTRPFTTVMGKMEDLGASESRLKAPIYVAHF